MQSKGQTTLSAGLIKFKDEEEFTPPSMIIVTGELLSEDEDGCDAMVDDDNSPEKRNYNKKTNRII